MLYINAIAIQAGLETAVLSLIAQAPTSVQDKESACQVTLVNVTQDSKGLIVVM